MSDYRKLQSTIERMSQEDGPFRVVHKTIKGIDYPVYRDTPDSLRDLLTHARQYGEQDFIVYRDERLSFKEVLDRSAKLANSLIHELGIRKGDRVGIAMRNYPEWMIAFIGIVSAGAIVVPLNTWWGSEELGCAIDDSGVTLIFVDDQRLTNLLKPLAAGRLRAVVVRSSELCTDNGIAFESLCRVDVSTAWPKVAIEADDLACIMYTSGSTGDPKGAVSTHRAIVHTLLYWLSVGAAATAQTGMPTTPLAVLLSLPLFHITGCHSCFLCSLLVGRKVVLMHKWEVTEALRLIEAERITSFYGVPTMTMELLTAPDRMRYDLSSLTEMGGSGASTPPERVRQMGEEFPRVLPFTGYGMTETNALGCFISGEEYYCKPASVGLPNHPLVQIRLINEQGSEVAAGEQGEVYIKSITTMDHYWNQPEATVQTLRDGWLRSGDIGRFDEEGYLHLVERIKEIIIRGGENICCGEVETAIYEHPDVLDVSVYGVPDERLGEVVAASVVLRDCCQGTPAAIQAFLSARLAKFKIPVYIDLRKQALPKLVTGKTAKRQLQQEFNALRAGGVDASTDEKICV